MAISIFDLFTIGIGPSSSHTVGPMRAARRFAARLVDEGTVRRTCRLRAELYGSLGATGKGHGTDRAIVLGLAGQTPEGVDPDAIEPTLATVRASGSLAVMGTHAVPFSLAKDM